MNAGGQPGGVPLHYLEGPFATLAETNHCQRLLDLALCFLEWQYKKAGGFGCSQKR